MVFPPKEPSIQISKRNYDFIKKKIEGKDVVVITMHMEYKLMLQNNKQSL